MFSAFLPFKDLGSLNGDTSMETDSWRRSQVTGLGAEGQPTLWKGRVGQAGGRQAAASSTAGEVYALAPTHTSLGSH